MDNDSTLAMVLERRKQAELKAWKSLAGYKFYMFGYWAAAWVKYNALVPKDHKLPNPFSDAVHLARDVLNTNQPGGA